ncbi:MAG: hypothetical protein NTW33_10370 [Methanoregula sp.]|nr:hypothetical protein [Methanoregula sp.]
MDTGYLTFQAHSPKGFSSFALIAEIPLAATPATQIAPHPSTSKADLRD